jgi:DNA-binding ferritin-like protein (Dps family)
VALLRSNRLVAVSRYDEPRPRFLADPSPFIADDIIHSWALIPPAYTLSRHVEVLLSTGQTILVVDPTDAQDQDLQSGPFTHISVSPNGRYVALYTAEGRLWVIKADFQDKLSEYNSGMGSVMLPRSVEWCGNDSVVIAWDDEVHMVGPKGEALKYYYDSRVHLVPDIDGVRLLTAEKCELLQKVPDVTEEIFKIGATSSASILLDAVDQLEKKSPKADDNISLIRNDLAEAVDACIKAAGHEFSVHWQKQLLKAASFGKSVPALYSSDDFVDMCETLRVLNAVRFFEVGIPITYEQFIRLTPEKLIQRLVNRQQHLLALRISEHLRLPTNRIYIHWACMKVYSHHSPTKCIIASTDKSPGPPLFRRRRQHLPHGCLQAHGQARHQLRRDRTDSLRRRTGAVSYATAQLRATSRAPSAAVAKHGRRRDRARQSD